MRVPLLLLVAILVPPFAAAQAGLPPVEGPGVASSGVGPVELAAWIGTREATVERAVVGENVTLWFALRSAPFGENATARTAFLNLTGTIEADARIEYPAGNATVVPIAAADEWTYANVTVHVAEAVASVSIVVHLDLLEDGPNGTSSVYSGNAHLASFAVENPAIPGGPVVPTSWLVAGGAVVVLGAGAAAVGMRRRAMRRRMNEAPRRSQVMREMELEQQLGRTKDPEKVAVIQEEIRQQEVVRVKRRELQILEAKRADALKTIELLRKRHEAGGLSKLQFDNMVAKKQADLARIEAEIASMESEESGAAAT